MDNAHIKVNIKGKNINNYIKWLISNKIKIYDLEVINHHELNVTIELNSYKLLKKYSKTVKITIIKKYGILYIMDIIKTNIYIIIFILMAVPFLYFLSNIIFSIDIIYNDQELVSIVRKELVQYDIKPFKLKKSYEYIEYVKEEILNNNKDHLEWIEIEESGTKYIVRLVERKIEEDNDEDCYQSLVASKDAIIKSIRAYSGEKVKLVNEYVRRDEVIVSGILTKPDGTNIYTKATGKIYGEVWYKVTIEYPLYYQEELLTGKSKNILMFNFLNYNYSLFPYKKYKNFKSTSEVIVESDFLPLKISREKIYEVSVKEEIYTIEEAISKAKEVSIEKIISSNDKINEIKDIMIISKENYNSKIKLEIFISVIEDITKIVLIEPEVILN